LVAFLWQQKIAFFHKKLSITIWARAVGFKGTFFSKNSLERRNLAR
jgi:hypothetical protein